MNLAKEIIVDNFAGGGGASTGIELATGRSVDIAINHDPAAIKMHMANHPDSEHYCESVWDVVPLEATKGRPVALCWLSPDCKHFSKAKGGKPKEKNIRGLAWVAVRWASTVKPRVIMLENVEEFKTWGPLIAKRDPETGRMLKVIPGGEDEDDQIVVSEPGELVPHEQRYMIPDPKRKGRTFNSFVNALRRQGYQVEWRELRACDYGAPTIRKRFFLIARCDGRPIVWPKPTHGDPDSLAVKAGRLKPWRTAAEIIDWGIPCPSIFSRKKPLAENTLKRIARGIQRFVIDSPNPFIIKVNHQGEQFRGQEITEPMQTITAKNGWGVVTPYIARIGQTGFGRDRMQYRADAPLTTITTKAEHLLIQPVLAIPHITKFRGGATGHNIEEPLHTITSGAGSKRPAGAAHAMGMVTAFLARHFGESVGHSADAPVGTITAGGGGKTALVTSHLIKFRGENIGQPAETPLQTVTAGGNHFGEVRTFLMKYYGSDIGQACNDPLHTVTTKDRFGLVTVHGQDYEIVDIGMRMLEPHELFAAQGFPKNYIIDKDNEGNVYSKAAQVARCGNAVPPPFAEHLVRANLPEHCTGAGTMFSFERYAEAVGQLELSL